MLRAAPCPGHPGTPRCSEPDPVALQGARNLGRGGAVGSTGPDSSDPWIPSVRRPQLARHPDPDQALTRGHQRRTHSVSNEH